MQWVARQHGSLVGCQQSDVHKKEHDFEKPSKSIAKYMNRAIFYNYLASKVSHVDWAPGTDVIAQSGEDKELRFGLELITQCIDSKQHT